MKAVILAGGKGTRLSEETYFKPKPMVEIGGMPILWHIMKIYSAHGVNDFVICCGYKDHLIKEFFSNYVLHRSDVTFDLTTNKMEVHLKPAESWRVTLVYTGMETMTGGRLKRVKEYIGRDTFCFTYGDGLSDVNITKLIHYHKSQKKLATVTASRHQTRFGVIHETGGIVTRFTEKPIAEDSRMNSGFFVMEPRVLDYIESDTTVLEREPLQKLVQEGQLASFPHEGFFQGMDSLRDRTVLEELWNSGKAPWNVWS